MDGEGLGSVNGKPGSVNRTPVVVTLGRTLTPVPKPLGATDPSEGSRGPEGTEASGPFSTPSRRDQAVPIASSNHASGHLYFGHQFIDGLQIIDESVHNARKPATLSPIHSDDSAEIANADLEMVHVGSYSFESGEYEPNQEIMETSPYVDSAVVNRFSDAEWRRFASRGSLMDAIAATKEAASTRKMSANSAHSGSSDQHSDGAEKTSSPQRKQESLFADSMRSSVESLGRHRSFSMIEEYEQESRKEKVRLHGMCRYTYSGTLAWHVWGMSIPKVSNSNL